MLKKSTTLTQIKTGYKTHSLRTSRQGPSPPGSHKHYRATDAKEAGYLREEPHASPTNSRTECDADSPSEPSVSSNARKKTRPSTVKSKRGSPPPNVATRDPDRHTKPVHRILIDKGQHGQGHSSNPLLQEETISNHGKAAPDSSNGAYLCATDACCPLA